MLKYARGCGALPLPGMLCLALLLSALMTGCPDTGDDEVPSPSPSPTIPPQQGFPRLALSTSLLDFGELEVGTTLSQTLEVSNAGDGTLTATVALTDSAEAQFGLETSPLTLSVAAGEAQEVRVTFAPSAQGFAIGALEVSSNDESHPLEAVALIGAGALLDWDADGYESPEDCDDHDPFTHPFAEEACDLKDNDCDSEIDEQSDGVLFYADEDGDGHGDPAIAYDRCTAPLEAVTLSDDCDDTDSSVFPGAPELCDGLDNDCDFAIDEDDGTPILYPDEDQDGHGDLNIPTDRCDATAGYVITGDDCDDGHANTYPGAEELCDQRDNDCDGEVDELLFQTYYLDADSDGWGGNEAESACAAPEGYVSLSGDCDEGAAATHPEATEHCDGKDNDCDGATDEDALEATVWYLDEDEDGYGVVEASYVGCTALEGYVALAGDCVPTDPMFNPGAVEDDCSDPTDYNCDGSTAFSDEDEDGFPACQECNDRNPDIFPEAEEICDGLDNNCNGVVDEGTLEVYYEDADGDGFGTDITAHAQCAPGPSGYVTVGGDCLDQNSQVFPGASELCNGRDDDCDGQSDEVGAFGCTSAYLDLDGDGYGQEGAVCVCSQDEGYASRAGDCDDHNAMANPSRSESCNGFDDDCDSSVDEAKAEGCEKYYQDSDQDGYGNTSSQCLCGPEDDFTTLLTGDCLDTDGDVFPTNLETCEGKDNNCNGMVDEGVLETFYYDYDGDGYGASYNSKDACQAPSGYVSSGGDCNDYNDQTYPTSEEVCNDLDEDCDGLVDEGLPVETIYRDGDGDGYAPKGGLYDEKCDVPVGWTLASDADGDGELDWDCDDTRITAYPGATELCDDLDNNCDGFIDTHCPSECSGTWPVLLSIPSHMPARLLDYNGDSLEEVYVIDANGKLQQVSFQGVVTTICSSLTFYTGYGNKFGWTLNPELGAWKYYFQQGTRLYDLDSCTEVKASSGDVAAFGGVGDFDGDGKLDYVGHLEINATVCFKLSSTGYTTQCLTSPNGKPYDSYPSIEDVDGDGRAEALLIRGRTYPNTTYYDGTLDIYGFNNGVLSLQEGIPPTTTGFVGSHISGLDIADFYGDGFQVMTALFGGKVVGLNSRTVVATYTGDGDPNPRTFDLDDDGILQGVKEGALVDLDFDHVPEMIQASGNQLQVLTYDPGAVIMDGWPVSIGTVTWSVGPIVGDVDNDGRLDVFAPSYDGALYCFRLGKGSSQLTNVVERGEPDWVNRTMTKDPFEPNDGLTSASPLRYPTKEVRALLTQGDVDVYRLPGVGGLYIQLYSPEGLDYDFVWTNGDGTVTYASSTKGAGQVDSAAVCVSCNQTAPSSYAVKVYPKNGSSDFSNAWPYVLKINKLP